MEAVLWIRDIVVRILVSVPLIYGYGSGPCFIGQWLTSGQQKKVFFEVFFACYRVLSDVHLHQSSGIKKITISINQGFSLTFLLVHGIILDPYKIRSGSGRPKHIRILRIWIHNTG
jgi:hypothetical protein